MMNEIGNYTQNLQKIIDEQQRQIDALQRNSSEKDKIIKECKDEIIRIKQNMQHMNEIAAQKQFNEAENAKKSIHCINDTIKKNYELMQCKLNNRFRRNIDG